MMTTANEVLLGVAERITAAVVTHMGDIARLPHGESILLGGIGTGLLLLSHAFRRMMSRQRGSQPDACTGSAKAASAAASVQAGGGAP
ncbi:MAG: hypothetical protein JWN43_3736 [Gammaproteobacteria bacterium]|nr:hypothetical protein [Gammaproteobacteria bacterium]